MMYRKILNSILMTLGFAIVMLVSAQDEILPINQPDAEEITQTNVGNLLTVYSFDESTKQAIFSSDATMIAVAQQQGDSDFSVSVIDLRTSNAVLNIQGRMDFFRDLFWSPDSTRLAITSVRTTLSGLQETSIKLYTVSQDNNYLLGSSDVWYTDYFDLTHGPQVPTEVVWNPTSTMIAVTFQNQINIFDGLQDEALVSLDMLNIVNLQWSSDGKFIVIENVDGEIEILGISI